MPIDETTRFLGLPLPHPENFLEDDVPRLRLALQMLDEIVAGLAGGRAESTWSITETIPDGGALKLPVAYRVGVDTLLLCMDNVLLNAANYALNGAQGESSTTVTMLFEAPAQSEFHLVLLPGLGASPSGGSGSGGSSGSSDGGGGARYDPATGAYYGPITVGAALQDMKDSAVLILVEPASKAASA